MHFSASSQWSKICFVYQEMIFDGENILKFSQIVLVRLGGSDHTPHPQSQFSYIYMLLKSLTYPRALARARDKYENNWIIFWVFVAGPPYTVVEKATASCRAGAGSHLAADLGEPAKASLQAGPA